MLDLESQLRRYGDTVLDDLPEPVVGGRARRPRRSSRLLAAAAACLLFVLGGLLVARGDREASVDSTGQVPSSIPAVPVPPPVDPLPAGPRLLPKALPDGWRPILTEELQAGWGEQESVQVFGTAGGSGVLERGFSLLIDRPVRSVTDGTSLTVGGSPARWFAGQGAPDELSWERPSGRVQVAVRGLSHAEALVQLERLRPRDRADGWKGFDPSLDGGDLSLLTERIVEPGQRLPAVSRVWYAPARSFRPQLYVESMDPIGGIVAADALNLSVDSASQPRRVGSTVALEKVDRTADGWSTLQWIGADGRQVALQAHGVDAAELEQFAASVAPTSPDQWNDLVRRTHVDASERPEVGRSTDGTTTVVLRSARGARDGALLPDGRTFVPVGLGPDTICLQLRPGDEEQCRLLVTGREQGPTIRSPAGYVPLTLVDVSSWFTGWLIDDTWWIAGCAPEATEVVRTGGAVVPSQRLPALGPCNDASLVRMPDDIDVAVVQAVWGSTPGTAASAPSPLVVLSRPRA